MGKILIIGIGPGDHHWLNDNTRQALEQCSDVVGYGLYFDLLGTLVSHQNCHVMPLGQEIERADRAIELASQGLTVGVISSGDAGIYAMASVVFERLDFCTNSVLSKEISTINAIDVEVIPGISAMQIAASKAGAMLGHDFCAISLSDLLTPWDAILNRIECAAKADFVCAFYNPLSKKRDWQLKKALMILADYRHKDTPIVIGKNLTRSNEQLLITTLDKFDTNQIDMLTVILVGNTSSKQFILNNKVWVYTPRGYSVKPSFQ